METTKKKSLKSNVLFRIHGCMKLAITSTSTLPLMAWNYAHTSNKLFAQFPLKNTQQNNKCLLPTTTKSLTSFLSLPQHFKGLRVFLSCSPTSLFCSYSWDSRFQFLFGLYAFCTCDIVHINLNKQIISVIKCIIISK